MTAGDFSAAYFCMACPETFKNAEASNAHHDATGHAQTWRPSQGYAERERRRIERDAAIAREVTP